jgi:hypothetical protein
MAHISETVFLIRLQDLLTDDVGGLDAERKAGILRGAADVLERDGRPLECRMVPFVRDVAADRRGPERHRAGAVVYEIGVQQYRPVLNGHPEIVDVLTDLMTDRLRERRERLAAHDAEHERVALGRRIQQVLFAP